MPGTPLITFSRGVATVLAATSAFAPLYLARMETDGGAMSGKSSTGKVKKDKSPSNTKKREITSDKTGLLINKSNIAYCSVLVGITSARVSSFSGNVEPVSSATILG